jgi:ornithine cyclodeaminase
MTKFIDVPTLSKITRRVGIQEFFRGLSETLEEDFARWEEFDKCPRVASHSDIGVIELMPVSDQDQYAFKYVNGHPENTSKGLPTVMAFGALCDVKTGYPVLLSELTLTTAFRTAATSAFAATLLARPDSRKMGIIGCGAQSEFQAIAFHTLVGINEVFIYDIDAHAVEKLARHLESFSGLKVNKVDSAFKATKDVDIITTVTADKAWATILTPEMVSTGTHINAVGGDCPGKTELHVDVLKMAKIFVELESQTRIEGEIQQLPSDHVVHNLWQVVGDRSLGRDSSSQITIFDSVGFALEDYSALRYVNKLAMNLGEGESIALVPDLADPKDLFQLTLSNSRETKIRKAA